MKISFKVDFQLGLVIFLGLTGFGLRFDCKSALCCYSDLLGLRGAVG